MNKITAALSTRSTFSEHFCTKNTDSQDKHHTLFTKRLAMASNLKNKTDGNIDEVDHNRKACSLEDFIGGPIDDDHSFNLPSKHHDESSHLNRSITSTPADSSCGFHNTFSVLEKHLNKNKCLRLNQQQVEYLLLQNKDLAVYSDCYIDIPIESDGSFRSVNSLVNSALNSVNDWDICDEEIPNLFGLELEAMERLRSVLSEASTTNYMIESDRNKSPPTNQTSSFVEKFYQQDGMGSENSNEYIYHVAKSRNGQLYIRVRRNLLLDQGKYIEHNFFSCIFTV